jgi:hypothetical protein
VPINLADKIVSIITAMTPEDYASLAPAEKHRLVSYCRHVIALCEFRPLPKAGVLADLKRNGAHAEL